MSQTQVIQLLIEVFLSACLSPVTQYISMGRVSVHHTINGRYMLMYSVYTIVVMETVVENSYPTPNPNPIPNAMM